MDELDRLRADVDLRARDVSRHHVGRLRCGRGCSDCCLDDLTVLDVEARRIRERHAALLRDGQPHPVGACAFLDGDGACRIYEDRPYVCRTQGLPLRWFEEGDSQRGGEPEVEERRDICPLNDEGVPIEQLPDDVCWLLGPFEARLEDLQEKAGAAGERTRLRSLFGSSG